MKRLVLIVAAFGLLGVPAAISQDKEIEYDPTRVWDLKDVVEFALENNVKVQTQQIVVENKEIDLKTTQFSRLPSLSASIDETANFGRSQNREGVTQDKSSYNTGIGAMAAIPVFEGFKINNQAKSDKFSLEAARMELEQTRQDIALKIVGYYLTVLYNIEARSIAEEQVRINRQLVEKVKAQVDGGKSSKSDLYDAISSLATSESGLVEAGNNYETAMLDLVQAINYPDYRGFQLVVPNTEILVGEAILTLTPADSIYESYLSRRPGILAAENRVKMAEKNVKVAQSQYWPSINLGVNYGTSYFSAQQLASGQGSFFNQLGNNGQVVIGASMSIPIFNRMATYNSVRTAKNNVRTQKLTLQQNKLDAIKEVQTAYVNATTSLGKYEAGQKSEDAARKAFEFEQKKFDAGRSTAYQYNEMRQKHETAKSKLIQAKYNFLFRSKILDFYKGNPLY